MDSLKIAIVEDGNGEAIDMAKALGVPEERIKFLVNKMVELAAKFCKKPYNGTCSLHAIREISDEIKHPNELFLLGSIQGQALAQMNYNSRPGMFIQFGPINPDNE